MNANVLKTALLYNFGFKKNTICCTELCYQYGNADVFSIPKSFSPKLDTIEIEIKTTKNDLMNEFKIDNKKHIKYNAFSVGESLYTPTKFYICVPENLVEFCKQKLLENNRDYVGIILYKPKFLHSSKGKYISLEDSVSIIKKAKRLNILSSENYKYFQDLMMNRLKNENVGFYKEKTFNVNRYEKVYESLL